ncbi:S-methyl thiohydantoin desulfurase domain-containing protein [Lutispora sp.]|uniref:S-methyl thiohydantoin desulfurase domain-containing protein n=1 Tax=Lutispora sp. TaxID=2828727 RepID=UPI002B1F5907|nr:DUF917 family protein [Lutispora sp.]MEA4963137.1 DUF917 family protein [Lutispora sp.]
MRKLYKQDIIEILYGATLLGAGGGGSLSQGLSMLKGLEDSGEKIELDLLELNEIKDNEYAAMVAGLGSPVAMLDPNQPMFGPDAVNAYRAFQKAFIAEGKECKYLYSGEMGGFNTFTPMLVAILSDKDPAKRIKFLDVDSNGRAVPELNTTLNVYYGHPPKPMGLGSLHGDEIAVYPITDHSGEQIARQLCMLYNMRIGFATWGMNKAEMAEALDVGCVTMAQNIGKAFLAAKNKGADLMTELKKVMEVREFCRGTIEKLDIKAEGGFDFGTTVVKGEDGHKYFIDFKNENLILRDENGKTCLTAPEGIGLVDLDTLTPLTNADTKEGMHLLVTMAPAHPNWWDEKHKAYTCWLPELERVGMKGKQVRY